MKRFLLLSSLITSGCATTSQETSSTLRCAERRVELQSQQIAAESDTDLLCDTLSGAAQVDCDRLVAEAVEKPAGVAEQALILEQECAQ